MLGDGAWPAFNPQIHPKGAQQGLGSMDFVEAMFVQEDCMAVYLILCSQGSGCNYNSQAC